MVKNQTITFQENTQSVDAGGSVTFSWSNLLTNVPCIVDDVSSSEQVIAERNGHFVSQRVLMSYNSLITKDLRVVWNSNNYQVTYVRNPNNLNRTLEIDIYDAEE